MTPTDYHRTFDGAKAVKVQDTEESPLIVVWHGGTYFNAYVPVEGEIHEVEGFSLSNSSGEPVERDEAIEHMADFIDRETEEAAL